MYCSVLQCVAVCCSMYWNVLSVSRSNLSTLQCIAVYCSVLQCIAVCCSVYWIFLSVCRADLGVLQCAAVCCSVLQCVLDSFECKQG